MGAPPTWFVGFVVALLYVGVVGTHLRSVDWDVTIFAVTGEDSPVIEDIERVLGRDPVGAGGGHDGQAFLLLSFEPWLISTDAVSNLDVPAYRAQRIFMPMLVSAGGLVPDRWTLYTTIAGQVTAAGLGTVATAELARRRRLSPWYGLVFAVNPGVFYAVYIGGSGSWGLALALWGLLETERGRMGRAAAWFTAAVLCRESFLLFVGAVVLHHLWARRELWMPAHRADGWSLAAFRSVVPWSLVLVPVSVFGAWLTYALVRLGTDTYLMDEPALNLPFVGLVKAMPAWLEPGRTSAFQYAVLLAMFVAINRLAWRVHSGALGTIVGVYTALAIVLGKYVWIFPHDTSRALSPVFTVGALLYALDRRRRHLESQGGPGAGKLSAS